MQMEDVAKQSHNGFTFLIVLNTNFSFFFFLWHYVW